MRTVLLVFVFAFVCGDALDADGLTDMASEAATAPNANTTRAQERGGLKLY